MFSPYLQRPGGRIVNIASASGPMYIQNLDDIDEMKLKLTKPWLLPYKIDDLDDIAIRYTRQHVSKIHYNAYGISKALLNAYTVLYAKDEPLLYINSCTPGFIDTEMTTGQGATNPPSIGAIPPCWLMMDERQIPLLPSGRYYGSDCIRSPIHYYREPGDLPYDDNNEDVIRRRDDSAAIRRR
jgi:carbonyl reductase 1